MQKATYLQTKHHNRDLVLRTIFESESISRAEVARVTRLTRTTVSEVVNSLLKEGLVEEIGKGESIGGKTPILLSIVADSRYMIGLNLAQDKFVGAIVNLRGEIKEMLEVSVFDDDGQKALESVYQIINQLIRRKYKPIIGIGIGTPGLVMTREGIVLNAVNLDWQDLPLGDLLQKKFKLPVSVLNDSQAAAIGEYAYGGKAEYRRKPDRRQCQTRHRCRHLDQWTAVPGRWRRRRRDRACRGPGKWRTVPLWKTRLSRNGGQCHGGPAPAQDDLDRPGAGFLRSRR